MLPTSPVAAVPAADGSVGMAIKGRLPPTEFPRMVLSCCTKIGKRKKQEDRCISIPRVFGRDDVVFLGVFDGTVGDTAAEFVHHAMGEAVCASPAFNEALTATSGGGSGAWLKPPVISCVETSLAEGFRNVDESLIRLCAERGIDYSSCTGVTAVVSGDLLSLAHVGDSKIVLGRDQGGVIVGKYLTQDHKPDMPEERKRIEASGGSLAYLHGGKPFIRGGDFTARQAKGDRPMQLNYSRAFGGKDLKMFGLISTPDVLQLQLSKADKLLILASDGLWDVATADTAAKRAWESVRLGRDPSLDLTDFALAQHDLRGSVDNVTVTVAVFR